MEIWKDIKGFEGHYQVSNLGEVRSLKTSIILKNRIYRGYAHVILYNGKGVPKKFFIHRLVAFEFIDNPENKYYINHLDQNPLNNSVGNLEWVTSRENNTYREIKRQRTSKYPGVCYDKVNSKWVAQIALGRKNKKIGRFNTEVEAFDAYVMGCKEVGIKNKYVDGLG